MRPWSPARSSHTKPTSAISATKSGPGSTVIDLEPNHVDDHLENIVIRNNFIDARTHKIQAGNGIVVQSTSLTRFVGPVLIEGNTIYGGNNVPPNITNILSNGIYVFGQTMRVLLRGVAQ